MSLDREFIAEWKKIKIEFEKCSKKISNYKTRPLEDEERKSEYKNEIVSEYNKIIAWIANIIEQFERDSQQQLLKKIDTLETVLIDRLRVIE